MQESDVSSVLEQLISDLEQGVPEKSFSTTDFLAKSLAKSLAIKSGTSLSNEAQEHMLNSLFACKEPHITPDQKPTFITIDSNAIEKKFM